MQAIKEIIKRTFLYDLYKIIRAFLDRIIIYIHEEQMVQDWQRKGKLGSPPHAVKQRVVKEYARKFSVRTLVETGTWMGDMVEATRSTFSQIFSIELDRALYEKSKSKFAGFNHISIIQGDSGEVLPDVLARVSQPCLFWLDAHYSGGITARGNSDTPIKDELGHILGHSISEHVILIDDARCFTGQNGYPTIEDLRGFISKTHREWIFEIKYDIIRIHPPKTSGHMGWYPSQLTKRIGIHGIPSSQ